MMSRPDDDARRHEPPIERGPARWVAVAAAALIAILTLAAFAPGLDNTLLNWDDDRNFLENEHYRGIGVEQLNWAWSTYHLGVWQPVSWLLLGAQFEVWGLSPRTYHVFSLALHALNAVVFLLMATMILKTSATDAFGRSPPVAILCAAAAALLFAVHPLRVEPVSWISAQPYLPAALFYMLGVTAYIRGFRGAGPDRTPYRWLAVTTACYCLAVGSKAVAVTLPAILLLLDVYPLRRIRFTAGGPGRRWVRPIIEKAPLFLIAAAVSYAAAGAKDFNESRVPFTQLDMDSGLAQSAYSMTFYLTKTLAPADLVAYYRIPPGMTLTRWPFAAAFLAVVGLTFAAVLLRRRHPGLLAAWVAYGLVLLPNVGLIRISRQLATDRYSYLAIMPLMVLLAAGLLAVWQSPKPWRNTARAITSVAVIASVVLLTRFTRQQVTMWQDSETLWKANLAVDPKCAVAECNLGRALALASDDGPRRAKPHFQAAIDLNPRFTFARGNLGLMLLAEGRHDEAITQLLRALNATGTDGLDQTGAARAHAGLAIAYARSGNETLAWKHIRIAQKLGLPPAAVERTIDSF